MSETRSFVESFQLRFCPSRYPRASTSQKTGLGANPVDILVPREPSGTETHNGMFSRTRDSLFFRVLYTRETPRNLVAVL
ncbi:hypothetical protein M378DRAFT_458057 [Amanita muscaria Koide BX008]|uniref:Uncharacterized protein n=1 Tax=Amanita muscaria (strain Koide BX008) TaxID=946122 RepID=A0A0C2SQZ9_AMAMK|nr:hypothetical protein M378DRAFT_458057 [Amanita muscaria Koide BX008]